MSPTFFDKFLGSGSVSFVLTLYTQRLKGHSTGEYVMCERHSAERIYCPLPIFIVDMPQNVHMYQLSMRRGRNCVLPVLLPRPRQRVFKEHLNFTMWLCHSNNDTLEFPVQYEMQFSLIKEVASSADALRSCTSVAC